MTPREAEQRAQRAPDRTPQNNGSMTVAEWCAHRRLSRSMLYKLWAEGRGPAAYRVGSRRLISAEADAAWLREREAEALRETEAA